MFVRTGTILLVVAMLGISAGLLAADDPFIGTWKLNGAKSKYNAGPSPNSIVIKMEPDGKDGVKQTNDAVNAQGKESHWEFSGNYDGKDYPVTGLQGRDAISIRRIDSHTTEVTTKKAGKAMSAARRVVSKDGKTLTITVKNMNALGQPVNDVEVFDKQ